jgi:ParB family chromosome partitioning protein
MADQAPPDRGRRLGRGLGALISAPTPPQPSGGTEPDERLWQLRLELIRSNRLQPRNDFSEVELQELEASMRTSGLLQPITVRQTGSTFELIAGERRLRAARRLGWSTIPAIVRDISDEQLLTLALVENLQRADLNPIEEAEGYRRLHESFGLSQQQVAALVGKDRSTVANMLRLLTLPDEVQRMLRDGTLSVGHARALLGLPGGIPIVETARAVVRDQRSVRDVERMAQESRRPRAGATEARPQEPGGTPEARRITDRLRRYLQTDVHLVVDKRAQGELRIRFYSADDLERLLELIAGPSEDGQ